MFRSELVDEKYAESTQETLVGLYGIRDPGNGKPIESVADIVNRVSLSVAIAELKYLLSPEEIIGLDLKSACGHAGVKRWADIFADAIGNQKFWANTPANINADPEVSLKVLKYWAHGTLAKMPEEQIWLRSEELRTADPSQLSDHEIAMKALASFLRGKGCLAACGVTYVSDSLEGIQDAARIEALAAKAAMGMGINTSTLRPWSSVISTNGAAASGPDRFYGKTIAQAVEAVAQGGRRGGALIELRNSDHPDILFFIDKKKLIPPPQIAKEYREAVDELKSKALPGELKRQALALAVKRFGERYARYMERQNYLRNTNVTVLAMPGFMEAVEQCQFYPATFEGKPWMGELYDPRKPILDEHGNQVVDKLTKEPKFERYSVDHFRYREAGEAARSMENVIVEITDTQVAVRGHFYAPDVFDRIVEGMRDSGEPGVAFYESVNAGNANPHVYELNTCNPCGEQFLPAGPGKDGLFYMGNCNLSSMHAAHETFWDKSGEFRFRELAEVVQIQQRFMDNVTDVSWYPVPNQNMTARLERRNGGGFAGVAEHLSRLGVEFGSTEGLDATLKLYSAYTVASLQASMALAEERGVYPLWPGSEFEKHGLRVRNSCMTNNAPTGTLAQALQTSWGVDPHNGIVFSRMVRSRFVDFVAPGFQDMMQKYGAWPQTEEGQRSLIQRIRDNNKSCRGLAEVPVEVQKAYPIRIEIEPDAYIRHLAAIHLAAEETPWTFNSVSNTCSIPLNAPKGKIADAIFLAWQLGVKDITFYPDGSRLSQPVEKIASADYDREDDLLTLLGHEEPRQIQTEHTAGDTYKVAVGCPDGRSTLHVSLNHEIDRPGCLIEVYARMGKPGAVEAGLFEAVGRLTSTFLQFAAERGEDERDRAEQTIIKQLSNIQSGYPAWYSFPGEEKSRVILSPCDGLAKAIQHYRLQYSSSVKKAEPTQPVEKSELDITVEGFCPHCGADEMVRIDGCEVCGACGFSRCG